MQMIKNQLVIRSLFILCMATYVHQANAKTVRWCVYDFAGQNGDVMSLMKDYALASKHWGVDAKLKVYAEDQLALQDFKDNKCDAVMASSFVTRPYSHFGGTLNAVGLIPNHKVAEQVFLSLADPKLAPYMVEEQTEMVGWFPVGSAYFMVQDRAINSITHLAGLKVGVMKEDPSQTRLARRIGAIPYYINFKTASVQFLQREIDVLPAPIYAYSAFDLHHSLGKKGGVINYPISYISLNAIIKKDAFPAKYGQLSRNWFKAKTPTMMNNVLNWERSMPNKYWYDLPLSERQAYQRLVVQLRKEFIDSKVYHPILINLVLKNHCKIEVNYFECRK